MLLFQGQKRGRDEDDDIEYRPEHLDKRVRSGNTNTLFEGIALQIPQPPPLFTTSRSGFTLTPVHSDSEDNSPESRTAWMPTFGRQQDTDMDSDSDDEVEMTLSPPPESTLPTFARPARPCRPTKLDASRFGSPSANTGRIPTPINHSFGGGVSVPRLAMGPALRINTFRSGSSFQRTREHYMPSPICESPLVKNEPTTPSCSTENMFAGLAMLNSPVEPLEAVDSLGRPRKGRARSGAINSTKGRFALGYRDDCDKCHAKLPGHYSHVIDG